MERSALAALVGARNAAASTEGAVVESPDPGQFLAQFAAACGGKGNVFLSNPAWRAREREDLAKALSVPGPSDTGWLMIPSGGSGGRVKFARHDGWTLAAAVQGFRNHFGIERVNAVGVLPLHHVSGLMAWMRSVMTGGQYVPWAWKDAEAGRFPARLPADCCISLVPTQLQRLLVSAEAVAWLRGFKIIFVGGAPAADGLLGAAAGLGLPLSTGYGATETAAMVSALRPSEFLSGLRGAGSALPHARISIVEGIVTVTGESVFRGYFPGTNKGRSWSSGDLGSLDGDGRLQILGRTDDIIVTGGKKVSPAEVESALVASGAFADVAVVGVPHKEWGHAVVACHPPGPSRDSALVEAALAGLASYKRPKRYVEVSPWPRTSQGKIDRAELRRLAGGA